MYIYIYDSLILGGDLNVAHHAARGAQLAVDLLRQLLCSANCGLQPGSNGLHPTETGNKLDEFQRVHLFFTCSIKDVNSRR